MESQTIDGQNNDTSTSSEDPHEPEEGDDLIDFKISSPEVSRACSLSSLIEEDDRSSSSEEHLLDSGVLQLEEVLQTKMKTLETTSEEPNFINDKTDNVLITLEDDSESDNCYTNPDEAEVKNSLYKYRKASTLPRSLKTKSECFALPCTDIESKTIINSNLEDGKSTKVDVIEKMKKLTTTSTFPSTRKLKRSSSYTLLNLFEQNEKELVRSKSLESLELYYVLNQLDEYLNQSLENDELDENYCSNYDYSLEQISKENLKTEYDNCSNVNFNCVLPNTSAMNDLDKVKSSINVHNTILIQNNIIECEIKNNIADSSNQPSVEECLYDLDTYLQNMDNISSEEPNKNNCTDHISIPIEHTNYFNRDKLTSSFKTRSLRKIPFKRLGPYRNTIAVGERLKRLDLLQRIGVISNDHKQLDEEDYDDNIDWSWVEQIVAEEFTNCEDDEEECAEANRSGNKQTETEEVGNSDVTLACSTDNYNQTEGSGGASSADVVPEPCCSRSVTGAVQTTIEMKSNDEELNQSRNNSVTPSWLRSSMRRIRHFRLPTEPSLYSRHNEALVAAAIDNLTPRPTDRSSSIVLRPTSAPTRLSSRETRNRVLSPRDVNSVGVSGGSGHHHHRTVESRSRIVTNARNVSRSSRSLSRRRAQCGGSGSRARSSSESSRSRRPRSLSSTDSSLGPSSVDSTPSCSPIGSPNRISPDVVPPLPPRRPLYRTQQNNSSNTSPRRAEEPNNRSNSSSNNNNGITNDGQSPLGQWPHSLSAMLAYLSCTLGLFNISRFAILSLHFGANFIVQFMMLSIVFGVPLFTLHTCLGQQLGAGVIDMWRISPIFQGVGIALLIAHALLGMYSIVGISWMFVYFRDSFITKMDNYRWSESFDLYRSDYSNENGTYRIHETVPGYFSGVVLQRYSLQSPELSYGSIKFQPCFNLAVIWIMIFACLSKGLKSYGKVVYVVTLLPIIGMFVLCSKLLGMTPSESTHNVFPETSWPEFFLNTKCWVAAFQETFLTWGLLGAAAMQIASHSRNKHMLQRDTGLVVVITCTVLLLTAFLANTCSEIFRHYGYNYVPGSFETMKSFIFMRSVREPLPPSLATTPVRYMSHSSLFLGERVIRPGIEKSQESGYQVMRFATELLPATFALLGSDQLSPFWAVLFYVVMILFGLAQQLAIWYCVITGIIAIKAKTLKALQTTIAFFSCAVGFIIGLPLTTESGINVTYFLDYCIGGTWWIAVLYMLLIAAVFMVRGRPYSGDSVVTALFHSGSHACLQQWAGPLLSFTWNVILPVALVVYSVSSFKSGYNELFSMHQSPQKEYWSFWPRQFGMLLQLAPILTVPLVAFIQSYRYLNDGPPDILDRIQLLYRPPLDTEHLENVTFTHTNLNNTTPTNPTANTATDPAFVDPPPKYTPPPSYTTATGARIAKMLRQSFRRSMRRITNAIGESSATRNQNSTLPPPDYAAVLVEMNNPRHISVNLNPDVTEQARNHRSGASFTAQDVANILRSSFRRHTAVVQNNTICRNADISNSSLSAICLVDGAAPINQDSMNNVELKTNDNDSSSVI